MENRCSVFAVTALLLAAGGAGVWGNSPPEIPSGRLDWWRPAPQAALDLDRAMRERLEELPPEAEWRVFVDTWMSANLLAENPVKASGPDASRTNREALARLKAFRAGHTDSQYVALGAYLSLRFEDALARLAEGLAAAEGGALEWLAAHQSQDEVRTVRALSGAFPEVALSSGILRPAVRPDPDRLRVARLLWFERWLLAGGLSPLPGVMSSAERSLVLRWKVEDSEHLSGERRLELLPEAARHGPGYPERLVAGVLLYREGRTQEARQAFLESLAEDEADRQAAAWLLAMRRDHL
ncbi:MAG: hypothetical protein FJ109_20420 [Deltaproteobacteria bacterium]|nr:hypothetical protein [Deltaproteobacteria bacterium]